jgi:uncharacterized protein (DUF58 family)
MPPGPSPSGSLTPDTVSAAARPRSRVAFSLTRRGLLLFLAGALWLAPGFFIPRLAWGMAVWDILILALACLDAARLPAPRRITAERHWQTAPALNSDATIEVAFTQQGGEQLRAEVTDDLTAALVATPPTLNLTIYPLGRSTATYNFTPRQRGDHTTGRLYFRYRSAALGLVARWAVADLAQTVRIYPAVHATAEQSLFLTRSRQIELQQRLHRHRGLGRDFESLREYREGDDMRDLCWTATARRGVLVTRQFQTEKSQPVWLLMDAGRLLQARVATPNGQHQYTRLDYATSTALALSQLALSAGDRVGLLAYGQAIQQRIPLGRGAPQMRQLMESLAQVRGEAGEADHLNAAVNLNRIQPRRSLILWITDVAETSMRPEVIDGAAHLLRRHLVLFVAMRQTEMIALASRLPEDRQQMFSTAAAQELVHRRMILMAQLREQGALTLETAPEHLTAAVLNRYLDVKERALL